MAQPLSPRPINLPSRGRTTMKKTNFEAQGKPQEKPINKDKIEDGWRPSSVIAEPGTNPEMYITGKKLGKGGFAVCFEGTLRRTGQLYAMKVVKSKVEQKKQLEKVGSKDQDD